MLHAPRPVPTVENSLLSIDQAGWENVHVFSEPGSEEVSADQHVAVSRLGPFNNLLRSVTYLLDGKGYVLVFQDDVQVSRYARELVDGLDIPEGVVSLYEPFESAEYAVDGLNLATETKHGYGALGYLFTRKCAKEFAKFHHPHKRRGLQADLRVFNWCMQMGFQYHWHSPSLIMHTGHTSSLGDRPLTVTRQCKWFAPDARDLNYVVPGSRPDVTQIPAYSAHHSV